MDASPLIMDAGGSSTLPPKAYYFGDDVTDFGDDVRDFDDFQRHMFSDEDDLPTRGRSTDLRSHLEDLANRHPEFADHLRSPPGWVSDLRGGKWSGGRSASRDRPYFEGQGQTTADLSSQGHEQPQQQGQDQQESCDGASASGLNQHGLRNTVPDINSQATNEVRNQRSMSAPPDSNRSNSTSTGPTQQRFVSKIEINPVNPATGQTAADSKPPVPPTSKPNNMQNQPQHKTSTVRHIPIFVEGRDEPILPKNVDQDYVPPPPQPQQNSQQWQQNSQPRQQQQFNSGHQFQPQRKQSQQSYQAPYQGQQHHQSASPPPQQQYQAPYQAQHQSASPPPQQQRPHDQTDSVPNQQQQQQKPPPAPEQPNVNDPIYKVQCIQKEVDALKKQIEAFQGKSRADKEFIYLDEMLTRNLLKLDNISTEGKDNIRAVRKEAINTVNKCISLLESKVDSPKMDEDGAENKNAGEEGGAVAKMNDEQNVEQQMVTESGVAADGGAAPPKEENGPMEKVPKTDAQDNPNEIKC